MKIVHFPHPALTTKAQEVTEFNDEIKAIVDGMIEIMNFHGGVGLAANQVNILKRIFIMDCSDKKAISPAKPYVFINPEIIASDSQVQDYKEGCLSFPKLFVNVKRPSTVTVKWQDLEGAYQTQTFEGIEAVCVQHEIDHLNGIVFIDKVGSTKRQMSLQKYAKLQKK